MCVGQRRANETKTCQWVDYAVPVCHGKEFRFYPAYLLYIHALIYSCVCAHAHASGHRGQRHHTEVSFLLLLCEWNKHRLSGLATHPLPAEPSQWPLYFILNDHTIPLTVLWNSLGQEILVSQAEETQGQAQGRTQVISLEPSERLAASMLQLLVSLLFLPTFKEHDTWQGGRKVWHIPYTLQQYTYTSDTYIYFCDFVTSMCCQIVLHCGPLMRPLISVRNWTKLKSLNSNEGQARELRCVHPGVGGTEVLVPTEKH